MLVGFHSCLPLFLFYRNAWHLAAGTHVSYLQKTAGTPISVAMCPVLLHVLLPTLKKTTFLSVEIYHYRYQQVPNANCLMYQLINYLWNFLNLLFFSEY